MRVLVDEEYGWKMWVWNYPGTPEELTADWKAGRVPALGYLQKAGGFRGSLERLEEPKCDDDPWESAETEDRWEKRILEDWRRIMDSMDAHCHLHMENDSWLEIGMTDDMMPWPFQYEEEEEVEP